MACGLVCKFGIGLGLFLHPAGIYALQTGGPIRVVSRHRSCSPQANPLHNKGTEGARGGSGPSSPAVLTFESRDMFKVSRMAGRTSRKKKSRPRLSSRTRRLRRKVKEAGKVPDLSRMLRDGIPYLTRNEATELQLALAVSLYAHSKCRHEQHHTDDKVKAGVEVCLQLGRLRMGTDALLAAILSGVLRPRTSKEQPLGFGRARLTLVDIREGFGANVARLAAGLEHVTCVEETAHRILRGSSRDSHQGSEASLPPSLLVGASAGLEGHGGVGGGEGGLSGSLRQASALEQAEKLRNLIVSEAADWQVLTLRLAVHLQELNQSLHRDRGRASEQLARDALLVHGPLAHRLGVHQLRNELEGVAFRRLFPEQFNKVRRATEDRSSVYETVVEATKETLSKALKEEPDFSSQLEGDVVLQHRIKSPYSMWKKMEKKQVAVEGVFDAVAVRVVIDARKWPRESDQSYTARSERLCYKAMSVIQRLYPSVERRLKDYIATPKPNGYRSLHATQLVPDTATNGSHVAIEFQVRSKEMHQRAEFGLAAHWSYKGSGSINSSLDWITSDSSSQFKETKGPGKAVVPETVTSGRELVDWLHRELQQRKVFVFGPDKRIWELDKSSATAADALGRSYMQSFYEGTVRHGAGKRGGSGGSGSANGPTAWVNGQEVEPGYLLKNGDVFDVQDTRGTAPPSDERQLDAALD